MIDRLHLLHWVEKQGLCPTQFQSEDWFLDPWLSRVFRYGELRGDPDGYYWVPRADVIPWTQLGVDRVNLRPVEDSPVSFWAMELSAGPRVMLGFGATGTDALLSALNQVRLMRAAFQGNE